MSQAVETGTQDYFDDSASDPQWPNVTGLNMRVHSWEQDGVLFDTFEALGPNDQSSIILPQDFAVSSINDPSRGLQRYNPALGGSGFISGNGTKIGSPGSFIVAEGSRESACVPEYGFQQFDIVIELHGAFGFPDGICKFPITPEGPGPDFPSNTHWYPEMVGFGEIAVPGYEKLETMGWQSFWPNINGYDDSYCAISVDDLYKMGDPHDPSGPIANLIWTKRYSMVCRLVVGGSLFNDDVLITDFGYSDNFGDPNNVSYKITFKRYRSTSIFSVVNPDADLDHYTDMSLIANSSGSAQPVTNADPAGDGTVPNIISVPSNREDLIASSQESANRKKNLLSGRIVKGVTVRSITDPAYNHGNAPQYIYNNNWGVTVGEICRSLNVTWDSFQQSLNPRFGTLAPSATLNVTLTLGDVLYLALPSGSPEAELTPGSGVPNVSTIPSPIETELAPKA